MSQPSVQRLPASPSPTTTTGFNYQYFCQQWAILAQTINAQAAIIEELQAQVNKEK